MSWDSQWHQDARWTEVNGYGDIYGTAGAYGDYGKLFGQGGWFQQKFRPAKYEAFQAGQSAADIEFQAGTGFTDEKVPFWKRIFQRDPDRVAARKERKSGRQDLRAASAGGAQFSDPSGKWRYVSNPDGTYQVFKKGGSGWKRVRSDVGPGDGSMFTSIDNLAKKSGVQAGQPGSRGGGWAEAAVGLATAVPGILSAFGIGQPVQAAMPDDMMMTDEPQQKSIPWVPIGIAAGAAFVIYLAVRNPRTPPSAAPAAPRRRRTR